MSELDDTTRVDPVAVHSQGVTRAVAALASVEPGGDVANRYTESALLGEGGMGKVMLSRDERIGRDVAVKQLHRMGRLGDPESARFLREARVQGQLEHPSIVPVYDLDQREDGVMFFTMRRVLGHTVLSIIDELRTAAVPPRYTQRELLGAFATVCLAIDYAHSRGVIHRDLKPANLMLGDFGEVYVLDWGIARLVNEAEPVAADQPASRLSSPGSMMGTPQYMAPEQFVDPAVGPEADVFSLGMILFEMLTYMGARDPGAMYAPIEARTSIRAPDRDIAPELEAICVRATDFDPAKRFPSARALHAAVARYLDGDRELAQRRSAASGHAMLAQTALVRAGEPGADYEAARGEAMRELVRALSLDPDNRTHVAALATMMQTLPDVTPPEVEREIATSDQVVVRQGTRDSIVGLASWFLFLPVLWGFGLLHLYMVAVILGPIAISIGLGVLALKRHHIGRAIQLAAIASGFIAMVSVSRIFGPLVLGPTLIAAYAISIQIHPARTIRMFTTALACVAMITPMVLELVGVLPASYVYDHGRMTILPQVVDLSPGVSWMLLMATLISLLGPTLFVSRIRVQLSAAQRRLQLQSWHFRRLGERT